MPKMRTRRAAAKRFSATANGKIKRGRKNSRHILEKKTQERKKRASQTDYVHAADVNTVKKMLPYIGV